MKKKLKKNHPNFSSTFSPIIISLITFILYTSIDHPPHSTTMSLFGLGNALFDISVNATDELFKKYDLTCPNAILAEEKHVPLFAEVQAAPFVPEYVAGGSCQNSIRVAQWMLQEKGATAFTGSVGNDKSAAELTKCAQADGVNVQYHVMEGERTGQCCVLIHDFDRSMVTDLQAASKFRVEFLQDTKELWSKADYALVEGYFLTVSQDSIITLAKSQMERGKTFAFSLSAPFICQFFTEGVKAVLAYTDLVFGNETEAELISEALGWDLGKDHVAIAKKLAEYPFAEGVTAQRKVVITRGASDVVVATTATQTTFPVTPMPKEEMVDTNGAGDAFCGGFIAALIKGKSDDVAVNAGNYAAQTIIRSSGTSLSGVPTFQW